MAFIDLAYTGARFGFRPIAEHGVYPIMEWRPPSAVTKAPLPPNVEGVVGRVGGLGGS
jgi:hypothetical protein